MERYRWNDCKINSIALLITTVVKLIMPILKTLNDSAFHLIAAQQWTGHTLHRLAV